MSRRRLSALLTGFALLALLVAFLAPAAGAQQRRQRIVALTPFAANTLARLGVTPVAVGQTAGRARTALAQTAPRPDPPLSHPIGPNLEQLTSLRPGLVLSSKTWAKGNAAMEATRHPGRTARPGARSPAPSPTPTRSARRWAASTTRGNC